MNRFKKYSSHEINSLSRQEWNELIAKELNQKGFRKREYINGDWVNTGLYSADYDTDKFFYGIAKPKEIEYLKEVGLLNNGRCPHCGNPIHGNPGTFTYGNLNYHVCHSCTSKGVNRQRTACVIGLLSLPLELLLLLFRILMFLLSLPFRLLETILRAPLRECTTPRTMKPILSNWASAFVATSWM